MDGERTPEVPGPDIHTFSEVKPPLPSSPLNPNFAFTANVISEFLTKEGIPDTELFPPAPGTWPKRWKEQGPETSNDQQFMLRALELERQIAIDIQNDEAPHATYAEKIFSAIGDKFTKKDGTSLPTSHLARRIGFFVLDAPYYELSDAVHQDFAFLDMPPKQQYRLAKSEMAACHEDPELAHRITLCHDLLLGHLPADKREFAKLVTSLTIAQIRHYQDSAAFKDQAKSMNRSGITALIEEILDDAEAETSSTALLEIAPTVSQGIQKLGPYRHNPSSLRRDVPIHEIWAGPVGLGSSEPMPVIMPTDKTLIEESVPVPEHRVRAYELIDVARAADAEYNESTEIQEQAAIMNARFGFSDVGIFKLLSHRMYAVACHIAGVSLERAAALQEKYAHLEPELDNDWREFANTVVDKAKTDPFVHHAAKEASHLLTAKTEGRGLARRVMLVTLYQLRYWEQLEQFEKETTELTKENAFGTVFDLVQSVSNPYCKVEPRLRSKRQETRSPLDHYRGTQHLPIEEIWNGPFEPGSKRPVPIKTSGRFDNPEVSLFDLTRRIAVVKNIIAAADRQSRDGKTYVTHTATILQYFNKEEPDEDIIRIAHRARHAAFTAMDVNFTMYSSVIHTDYTSAHPFIRDMSLDALSAQDDIMRNPAVGHKLDDYLRLLAAEGEELDLAWQVAAMTLLQIQEWQDNNRRQA